MMTSAILGTTMFKQKNVDITIPNLSKLLVLDTLMVFGIAFGEVSIDNLFTISKN